MPTRDVIVIGTSAGGVEALRGLVADLPADFPAAVFIVLHQAPDSPSLLQSILERETSLPVISPADGDEIRFGSIFVAPPDRHLILERGRMRVSRGPAENRHRPAIDPLFRSAALHYGQRVVGVILTGGLDDGSAGLMAVKRYGGAAVVQDPADALYPDMPRNALRYVETPFRPPLRDIPSLLEKLVREPLSPAAEPARLPALALENAFASQEPGEKDMGQLGELSTFTCPSCSGTLWEMQDGSMVRYRCHVGHSYTMNALSFEISRNIENALYSALRAMEDKITSLRKLALRVGVALPKAAREYERKAEDQERDAQVIRSLLVGLPAEHGEEVGSGR